MTNKGNGNKHTPAITHTHTRCQLDYLRMYIEIMRFSGAKDPVGKLVIAEDQNCRETAVKSTKPFN